MTSPVRQVLYAVLALAGLVVPWLFNLRFMQEQGAFGLAAFLAGGYANAAAASLTSDLMVAFTAFVVWLPGEARRSGVPAWGLFLVLGVTVSFAFAFPLFLLLRERRLSAPAARAAGHP